MFEIVCIILITFSPFIFTALSLAISFLIERTSRLPNEYIVPNMNIIPLKYGGIPDGIILKDKFLPSEIGARKGYGSKYDVYHCYPRKHRYDRYYHKKGCSRLYYKGEHMHLYEAMLYSLKPCPVCNPEKHYDKWYIEMRLRIFDNDFDRKLFIPKKRLLPKCIIEAEKTIETIDKDIKNLDFAIEIYDYSINHGITDKTIADDYYNHKKSYNSASWLLDRWHEERMARVWKYEACKLKNSLLLKLEDLYKEYNIEFINWRYSVSMSEPVDDKAWDDFCNDKTEYIFKIIP